jgi:hypothetical protein
MTSSSTSDVTIQPFELAMQRFTLIGCPSCDARRFPSGDRQGSKHFAKRLGDGGLGFDFWANGYLFRDRAFEAFTGDDGSLFVAIVNAYGVTENCDKCGGLLASVVHGVVSVERVVPGPDSVNSDGSPMLTTP